MSTMVLSMVIALGSLEIVMSQRIRSPPPPFLLPALGLSTSSSLETAEPTEVAVTFFAF